MRGRKPELATDCNALSTVIARPAGYGSTPARLRPPDAQNLKAFPVLTVTLLTRSLPVPALLLVLGGGCA